MAVTLSMRVALELGYKWHELPPVHAAVDPYLCASHPRRILALPRSALKDGDPEPEIKAPMPIPDNEGDAYCGPPYAESVEAMMGAEDTLSPAEWDDYIRILIARLECATGECLEDRVLHRALLSAGSRLRAESFIRTKILHRHLE